MANVLGQSRIILIPDEGLLFGRPVVVTLKGEHLYSFSGATMSNDLIDEKGFDCFFTEAEMLGQHCHLLETELAELHGELRESRGKIATLVLMWSGVSRELAKAEAKLRQVQGVLESTAHPVQSSERGIHEGLEVDHGPLVPFVLK